MKVVRRETTYSSGGIANSLQMKVGMRSVTNRLSGFQRRAASVVWLTEARFLSLPPALVFMRPIAVSARLRRGLPLDCLRASRPQFVGVSSSYRHLVLLLFGKLSSRESISERAILRAEAQSAGYLNALFKSSDLKTFAAPSSV